MTVLWSKNHIYFITFTFPQGDSVEYHSTLPRARVRDGWDVNTFVKD